MHAAEASGWLALARCAKPARRAAEPRPRSGERVVRCRAAAIRAAAHDAEGAGARAPWVDFAARRVARTEDVVDGVFHPFLDVAREIVDAVGRAPERKRADGGELGKAVAVVGDVLQGQKRRAVV